MKMSFKFYGALKSIIYEVETFLSVTLKDVKLPATALNEKNSILQKLNLLQEEFPQLKVDPTQDDSSSHLASGEQKASSDVVPHNQDPRVTIKASESITEPGNSLTVSVRDAMATCSHCGTLVRVIPVRSMLDMKQVKQRLEALFGGKKFCVIADGTFYIFNKESSKKQNEAFLLQGYEAKSCDDQDVIAKGGKETFRFKIVCPGKKSYMFAAESQNDRDYWISALNLEALKAPASAGPAIRDIETASIGSNYEDLERRSAGADNDDDDENSINDDASYEDATPNDASVTDKNNAEEIYDDVGLTPPPAAAAAAPANKHPVVAERRLPAAPAAAAPAKTPVVAAKFPANGDNEYENTFYGLWDNRGVDPDELSFKRGDELVVVSREHDSFGWWVGELKGTIGLVPRDYLTPAYERVC